MPEVAAKAFESAPLNIEARDKPGTSADLTRCCLDTQDPQTVVVDL